MTFTSSARDDGIRASISRPLGPTHRLWPNGSEPEPRAPSAGTPHLLLEVVVDENDLIERDNTND